MPLNNFEFDSMAVADNYRRALIREFSANLRGRVIEVGSGIGQLTELLQKLPISFLLCVEPNPNFCSRFKKNLPSQPLIEGTIQDVDGDDWNVIVSVNVLEHIEDDESELKKYYEILKKEKGILNLFVPARSEIYSAIDKDFGHYLRYTKKEITKKLINAGFEIEKIRYFNLIGYFAWWLNFRIMKKRTFDIKSVLFFDKVIFPIVYFIESRVFAPPIGQSILVVARAK